jgi:lipopolysaccharide/colanic/teichoic acid biosynthesis glycosyltransferase
MEPENIRPLFRVVERQEVQSRAGMGYRIIKRAFDIAASLFGMAVLSPVFLITAAAILIEDGGPVFYTQNRIGMNKKVFRIYKFRSMRKDADSLHEEMREEYGCTEVSFKLKNDPRITKVGKIIRNTNIDELPQLFNILKGDMSIVGPRPLPDYEFETEQAEYHGKYDARYSVPQGLTCYWQVAERSTIQFDRRMEMDAAYAKEKGLLKDFCLIVKTIVYTVTGKAAY